MTIYNWIKQRRVERLIDAFGPCRASRVGSKTCSGTMSNGSPSPFKLHAQSAGGGKPSSDSPGLWLTT